MNARRRWCFAPLTLVAALVACSVYDASLLPGGPAGASGAGGRGGAGRAGAGGAPAGAGGGEAGATQGGGGQGGAATEAGGGGAGGAGGAEGCGRLVINEVQAAGVGGAFDEFIELFNAGTCGVVLGDWTVEYLSAKAMGNAVVWRPAQADRTLSPGQFFVIGGEAYVGVKDDVMQENFASMAREGAVGLFERGLRVDSVAWGDVVTPHPYAEASPAPAAPDGQSVGRKVNGVDTNDNAADFAFSVSTPGGSNAPPAAL